MQRVADAVLDRLVGRQQRLGDHLAAVDALALLLVGRRAAEEVHLQPLQPERLGKGHFVHGAPAMLQLRRRVGYARAAGAARLGYFAAFIRIRPS